jgi:hypothetical protein
MEVNQDQIKPCLKLAFEHFISLPNDLIVVNGAYSVLQILTIASSKGKMFKIYGCQDEGKHFGDTQLLNAVYGQDGVLLYQNKDKTGHAIALIGELAWNDGLSMPRIKMLNLISAIHMDMFIEVVDK